MINILSRVEKEVVLRYLKDENVPLVIQQTANSKNVATLVKSQFSIHPEGIILIANPPASWMAIDYTDVEIRFYYKKRGLFFNSTLRKISSGMAIVIPAQIRKQGDDEQIQDYQLTAILYFSCEKQDDLHIKCCPRPNYPLFEPFLWKMVSPSEIERLSTYFEEFSNGKLVRMQKAFAGVMQKTGKVLYLPTKRFPEKALFYTDCCVKFNDLPDSFEGAVSSLPYNLYIPLEEDGVKCLACNVDDKTAVNKTDAISENVAETIFYLIPICRFLAEEKQPETRANSDRVEPLSILYISDTAIIFGGAMSSTQFQNGQEYAVKISITTPVGWRDIFATCSVVKLYSNYKDKTCALCMFTSLKLEDKRLLFERIYKNHLQ